jgi:endonuclease G
MVLGVVATGSFAIAFGQEKILQLLPFTQSSSLNSACLNQFYRDQPPF